MWTHWLRCGRIRRLTMSSKQSVCVDVISALSSANRTPVATESSKRERDQKLKSNHSFDLCQYVRSISQ